MTEQVVSGVEERIDELEAALDEAKDDIRSLKEEIFDLNNTIAGLENDVEAEVEKQKVITDAIKDFCRDCPNFHINVKCNDCPLLEWKH